MNIDTNHTTQRPLAEMLRASSHTRQRNPSAEPDGGHEGGVDTSLLTSQSQAASAPGTGIYNRNGTLATSSLVQANPLKAQSIGDGDGDNDGK